MNKIVLFVLVSALLVAAVSAADSISCSEGYHYGPSCRSSCPSTHVAVGKRCQYKPKALRSSASTLGTGSKCSADVLGMFFSWTVYEHTNEFMMKSWKNYPRLESCSGNWVTVNEVHNEKVLHLINAHVSVTVNEDLGAVFFAFRGTELDFDRIAQMAANWAANFAAAKTEFASVRSQYCGEVHGGFYKNFMSIEQELMAQIQLFVNAGYKIYFTGHSYGGALSVIAYTHFIAAFPSYKQNMFLVTYAAPRVGNRDFGKCLTALSRNTPRHFIAKVPNGPQDIVPTVPLEIMGFTNSPGDRLFVACNRAYIGNPRKIPGISIGGSSLTPAPVGCHFQQPYIDGIIEGRVSSQPLSDGVEEMMELSEVPEFEDALSEAIAEELSELIVKNL